MCAPATLYLIPPVARSIPLHLMPLLLKGGGAVGVGGIVALHVNASTLSGTSRHLSHTQNEAEIYDIPRERL